MTRTRDEMSTQEMYGIIHEIQNCFNGGKCLNEQLISTRDDLMEVTENVPNFTIKIGSLLLVKFTDEDDKSKFMVKKLPISGLIHLDKNPHLINHPMQLIEEIQYF
jgi:hypothetical protein